MKARAPLYAKEMEGWMNTKTMKDVYSHKKVVEATPEHKRLEYDAMALGRDFATGRFHATMGFDDEGNYKEWVNNHDLKVIFEELYQIKEDLKALIGTKEVTEQKAMEYLTLKEPQFANMVKLMKEDIHYTTCEEL